MAIGAFRHRVTLIDPGAVLNPAAWDCSVQGTGGQVVDGQAAFLIRGRYHPGITLETQVIMDGRKLQVQSITDVDERHIELELLCVEVVARGREPIAY